jgi:hypothetical protein
MFHQLNYLPIQPKFYLCEAGTSTPLAQLIPYDNNNKMADINFLFASKYTI